MTQHNDTALSKEDELKAMSLLPSDVLAKKLLWQMGHTEALSKQLQQTREELLEKEIDYDEVRDERDDLHSRLMEVESELEQVKAERDGKIGFDWERAFPIIEQALGIELWAWQKHYLQTGQGMPNGRMNGRTTAYCIRLALTYVKPIRIEDIGIHRDEEHGSQYVRWFRSRFWISGTC